MTETKKEIVSEGKYLDFVRKSFMTRSGKQATWEMVERKNIFSRGAVAVIAVTTDNELVLERHWRYAIEAFAIQLPAGLTDREGETEEDTARRELQEETGYVAGELIPIEVTPECSVLTPSQVKHYLAPDVEYRGGENLDDAEIIEVLKIPLENLPDFLLNLPPDTTLDLRVTGILWILEKRGLIKY
ncbi:MAG: NUDIX hydrolase [Dehalococcoidales bacterium]